MMMPANFTAVNSEVVYGGADLLSVLADTTAPIWGASNVKTFNTNLLTILSNTFSGELIGGTMGVMFGGHWNDDDYTGDEPTKLFEKDGKGGVSGFFYNGDDEMTGLNKFMKTIGLAASVYTLGTTNVKNRISDKGMYIGGFGYGA